MPNTKISDLPAANALTGTEEIPLSDGTATSKAATATQIKTFVNNNTSNPGYSDFTAIADPAAPAASTLRFWADIMANRIVPGVMPPSGAHYNLQASLWGNQIMRISPATGTTAPPAFGGSLTSAGTISHPTPATTSRATVMARTRWANVATTTNQVLGMHAGSGDMVKHWRGNAAGLGGFFLFARFSTALIAAATTRLFVGLRSGTTAWVASDASTGDFCGFSRITTDAITTIAFRTRDNTTTNLTNITVPALAADVGFDAYIYCPPNDSTIFYRLDRIDTGAVLVDSSTTTNLPRNTILMGPEFAMSNGTANVTVTTTAFALNCGYIESDY